MSALKNQATRHSGRGEYRDAEACLKTALRSIKSRTASVTWQHLSLWNELGMICKYLGKFKQAEVLYRMALRLAPRCLTGRKLTFFLADLYHNLGGLEHARRRFRRGEMHARKGLELRRKVCHASGLEMASDLTALAAILDGLHKFADSEKLYLHALKIYTREYGTNHTEIAVLLNNFAAHCQATNQPRQAESLYLSSLRMKRRILPKCHPDIAVTMNNLALLYRSQGKQIMATRLFKTSVQILARSLGNDHPNTLAVRTTATSEHSVRMRKSRFLPQDG